MLRILIYDSGIGGQAVYDQLVARANESIARKELSIEYFADHANFPYGTKSEDALRQIVIGNMERFALQYDVIGVACNTASIVVDAWLPERLRAKVHTIIQPTVDAIVALHPERLQCIASRFTVETQIYSQMIRARVPLAQIVEYAEQELIALIEARDFDQCQKVVEKIIRRLDDEQVLVLACTHFSILKKLFEREILAQRKDVQIVDSASVLTTALINRLELAAE